MTTTVREVREAVATVLESIPHLTVTPYPTFALQPPHAVVKEGDLSYREVFGTTNYAFELSIIVFLPITDEQASQHYLDELSAVDGDTSIRQLVEEDATVQALVDYIAVDAAGPVELRMVNNDQNLLCLTREWSCRVDITTS